MINQQSEVLSLNIGLHEALKINPQLLLIEGDSLCAIKWSSQASTSPWYLVVIIEEVVEISKNLNFSFHHIKHSANSEVGRLAKEGVSRPSLFIVADC